MNNVDNKNWNLIGKYLNGEANTSEKEQVESWFDESDEFRKDFEKSKQMLDKIDLYYQSQKFNSASTWEKIKPLMQFHTTDKQKVKKQRKSRISGFYKYAAIILILLSFGIVANYTGLINITSAKYNEIVSENNQVIKNYILPDGSSITLNSNTTLKFPNKFGNNAREVTIMGEAFFDVTPNPEKPFIIHTGNAQIKVLGTSFNVCAYPDDEKVEVLVETGKVQVSGDMLNFAKQKPEVVLTAGEKGTLLVNNNTIEKKINTNRNLLSWKTGILEFSEIPLAEVINWVEKVYHVDIEVKPKELNNLVLTARFDEKPVDFILEVVRLTFDLEIIKTNDKYVLSKKTGQEKL